MATTKQNIKFSFGNWQKLPYHVFDDIMIMMGRESLNDLQKCRKVCKIWNVMMSQMTIYEKDNIRRKAESLAAQIREEWEDFEMIREEWEENEEAESEPFPPLPKIATTASLAHHGMFGSVELEFMDLKDVDLASVHVEHLASLFSCVTVTYSVSIINASKQDSFSPIFNYQRTIIESDPIGNQNRVTLSKVPFWI